MEGISGRSISIKKNTEKTFQSQRFDSELGLDWVQFKWRNHDPQIGRFIELDPLAEKYYYNSLYSFSENKVISHVELEGLEGVKINCSTCYTKIPKSTSESTTFGTHKPPVGSEKSKRGPIITITASYGKVLGFKFASFGAEYNAGTKEAYKTDDRKIGADISNPNIIKKGYSLSFGLFNGSKEIEEKKSQRKGAFGAPIDVTTSTVNVGVSIGIKKTPLSIGVERDVEVTQESSVGQKGPEQITHDSGINPVLGLSYSPLSTEKVPMKTEGGLEFSVAVFMKLEVKVDIVQILARIID